LRRSKESGEREIEDETRTRRSTMTAKEKKNPLGCSNAIDLFFFSTSTLPSACLFLQKKQNRLRPTAASGAAPSSSAPAPASTAKQKTKTSSSSSIDWRFVARHLPWLQALLVAALTVLPLIALEAAAKPRQRPFDVYDASISYSYRPDTVPAMAAVFAPVLVWLVTAAAVEFLAARSKKGSSSVSSTTAAALAVLYHTFDVTACLLVTALVTEATKLGVGRLRPYFLSACTPSDPAMTSQLAIGDARPPCDPVAGIQQRNARVSFPSGHSSTSMCTCAFAAFYVVWAVVLKESKEKEEKGSSGGEEGGNEEGNDDREGGTAAQTSSSLSPPSPKPYNRNGDFLRFVALLWALVLVAAPWVIGASRITDNRHHPSDVVAGLGLGFVVAGFFFARSVGGRRALPEYVADVQEERGGGGDEGAKGRAGRRCSEAETLV